MRGAGNARARQSLFPCSSSSGPRVSRPRPLRRSLAGLGSAPSSANSSNTTKMPQVSMRGKFPSHQFANIHNCSCFPEGRRVGQGRYEVDGRPWSGDLRPEWPLLLGHPALRDSWNQRGCREANAPQVLSDGSSDIVPRAIPAGRDRAMWASALRIAEVDHGLPLRLALSPVGRRADPWPSRFHQAEPRRSRGAPKAIPPAALAAGGMKSASISRALRNQRRRRPARPARPRRATAPGAGRLKVPVPNCTAVPGTPSLKPSVSV